MKMTEALLRDHAMFYRQFDGLEQALQAASAPGAIEAQVQVLDGALETHARLEDELLFAALEPQLGGMGPLGVMRMEHDEIDRTLAELRDQAGGAETAAGVRHLLETVRLHFAKEEQVLFPMAEQLLGDDRLEELGSEFVRRRGEVRNA